MNDANFERTDSMKSSTGRIFFGIFILFLGVFMLLHYFNWIHFSFRFIWPLFLLIPGLLFELSYFFSRKKNSALLVPGGILTLYGLVFLLDALYGWPILNPIWPYYLLGVAFGLLQHYAFGSQDRSLLLPIALLSLLSLGNIFQHYYQLDVNLVFPIILILTGIWVIIKRR